MEPVPAWLPSVGAVIDSWVCDSSCCLSHACEGSGGGGGAGEILNRFVEAVGASDARVRFLEDLGGIVVGVAILCLSQTRGCVVDRTRHAANQEALDCAK